MSASEIAELAAYCLGAWSFGWLFGVKVLMFRRFIEVSTR